MRLEDSRESSNIEDRREESFSGGGGGFRGGSLSIGTIILALVGMYFGIDPSVLLQGSRSDAPPPSEQVIQQRSVKPQDQQGRFVSKVLADTEDTWHEIFRSQGKQYIDPKLVLFRRGTDTACGAGQAAMGPFYCPLDQKVYIDLSFYTQLQERFKAPGDFAQAYVIAHEVGHHVQNLLGITEQIQSRERRSSRAARNALSVKLELQADCFAGIWANHANKTRHIIEQGDIEEALTAASAIGDDTLQKRSQGYAVPESFTHGSSTQRMHWFKQGLEGGRLESCDTFQTQEM